MVRINLSVMFMALAGGAPSKARRRMRRRRWRHQLTTNHELGPLCKATKKRWQQTLRVCRSGLTFMPAGRPAGRALLLTK